MDRTIKFRAWDKGWKQIVYPDIIHHNINLGFTIYQAFKSSDGGVYFPLQENLILMQFTGIYDCEGKEIWEGDILEIWIENIKQDNLYTVDDMKELYFEMNRDDSYYRFNKVKVIGNVYEHPNLLNND